MRLRYALVLAGILAVVGVFACGSSKTNKARPVTSTASPTTATTLEPAFIARANAVCARAKARLDRYGRFPYQSFDPLNPDVKLLPKIAAFFARRAPIADRLPVQLRDLGSPRRGQPLWSQLVALTERSREIAERQIAAARASDATRFVATVNEVHTTETQLQKLGAEGGFSSSSPCTALL